MEMAMRRYKVEIFHNGHVSHASVVSALAASEAKDQAWQLFDPNRKISLLDAAYATSADEL
jgi:hypothetical protein